MSVVYNTDDATVRIQNKITDLILVFLSFLGVLIILLSFIGVMLYGFRITTLVHSIVFMLIVTLALMRHQFTPRFKMLVLLFILAIDVLYSIYHDGFISSAKIVMAVLPVFLSFLFSFRKAMYFLFLLICAYLVLGFLHISGWRIGDLDPATFTLKPFAWIMDCTVMCFASIGLIYIAKTYNKAILTNSKLIKEQSIEIINRQRRFEVLFQSLNDAIFLFQDLKVVDCNQSALILFGYTKEELIGLSPGQLSPKFQLDGSISEIRAKGLLEAALTGISQSFEWISSKKNGQRVHTHVHLNMLILDNVEYVQAVVRNVSHQKRIEKELISYQEHLERLVDERTLKLEQANQQLSQANSELGETLHQLRKTQAHLIESEKLASVGILTAGISHEINNPLNFILGGLYRLKDTFSNPLDYQGDQEIEEVRKQTVDVIGDGAMRIQGIIKSLNHFNRSNQHVMKPCDIHEVLDNCLRILGHELAHQELIRDYYGDELLVLGNDGKLHQIFLNLIHNAKQALENSGQISISTAISTENHLACITISDTGCGIPKENMSKVFDPFFTTKPPGEGIGLGLFIAYQLVKDHDGAIAIESDEPGTRVFIDLPLASSVEAF